MIRQMHFKVLAINPRSVHITLNILYLQYAFELVKQPTS
jgi:hypothetical protein